MKKITAFISSSRKKNTYQAVQRFLGHLEKHGDVETEIVMLKDYRLEICRGCMLCFEKGEEFCPLKDDRDILLQKIETSDGVVFAGPNYTFDMNGRMKVFLDRFGFACHRPRYFGKTFTSIVTQGIGRGNEVVKCFDFVGQVLGFNTVKGACVTALDPRTEKDQEKINKTLDKQAKRFYITLSGTAYPVPSSFMLMGFRMGRKAILQKADPDKRDYQYYEEKGWLTSDYYYPVRLGTMKNILGKLFDRFAPLILKMVA